LSGSTPWSLKLPAGPATSTALATVGLLMRASTPEDFNKLIASDVAWMPDAAKGLKFE
jgi:hypothetical protein